MKKKKCNCCNEIKDISNFYKQSKSKDGYRTFCKDCIRLRYKDSRMKYRQNHEEQIANYMSEYLPKYYKNNKELIKGRSNKWYYDNIDYVKEYDLLRKDIKAEYNKKYKEENKEKLSEQRKIYRRNNIERISEYCKNYTKNRIANDELFKTSSTIRKNISSSFKNGGYTKKSKTYKILGCSWGFFKQYIEARFANGMCWDNYGLHGWHYDHIIPLATANTEEDIIKLCHYTNYQPLWSDDNRKKSNNVPDVVQFKLL